jgi:hypothetical protein
LDVCMLPKNRDERITKNRKKELQDRRQEGEKEDEREKKL